MLSETITMFFIGLIFIGIGLLIWKKEKISIITPRRRRKVKVEDKKAYTSMVGKGVVVIGTGCALTGLISYTLQSRVGWCAFGICMFLGAKLIYKAQKRYNRNYF